MPIMNSLRKPLETVIQHLKTVQSDTKEIVSKHSQALELVKDSNENTKLFFSMNFDLMRVWFPRVILPMTAIGLVMLFIKTYFVYLCLIGYIVYHIVKKSTPEIPADYTAYNNYLFVRNFVFDSLRDMTKYLPVQLPDTPRDIHHFPEIMEYQGQGLFAYKLTKLSSDRIDDSKLAFASAILGEDIEHKLNEYETANPIGSTFYGNVRKLVLIDIVDLGTHYLIFFAFVTTPELHEFAYMKQFSKVRTPSPVGTENLAVDDHF